MPKITFDKLIRDKIPEIMTAKGVKYKVRALEQAEFTRALATKVVEEAAEVHDAIHDNAELVKELADLQEVLDTLMGENNITREQVLEMQEKRRNERGGFEKKLFLEETEE